jgi:hypothetical protein
MKMAKIELCLKNFVSGKAACVRFSRFYLEDNRGNVVLRNGSKQFARFGALEDYHGNYEVNSCLALFALDGPAPKERGKKSPFAQTVVGLRIARVLREMAETDKTFLFTAGPWLSVRC